MKAPDKIYIQPNIGERELIKTWFPVKIDQESIEYTRTDAFIKKALEFFGEHLWDYINVENTNDSCRFSFVEISDKLKEGFVNYMKG